ncbi:TetR/AcrR family transcriptional regulator [Membranihabitans maritimus]|uniref:TetR/AcrR family transcriptional regulator n=1 Tax=Membranihabitans maritimus TaxID=2904244 RepID=UPI001EFFD14B|nr:TetR family transcriptional regulator [Membranihabitans maritimus]
MSKKDTNTEDKILKAANKVFTQKGFAATRTRDIAAEAGINLALLNYYFRSKKKLFDIVMLENLKKFLVVNLKDIFNNEKLSINQKVQEVVSKYTILLKSNPDLPIFILNEIKNNPQQLAQNLGAREIIFQSHFFKQLQSQTTVKISPKQVIINILGLTLFPFIAKPLIKNIMDMDSEDFDDFVDERNHLIPIWIDAILKE